jgi:4-cresol dehydrogenase (hydroxylating)
MDRIVEFNDELGYVRVEPGVTIGQLYTFLQERGGRFWLDSAGSSPGCSVIGNTLERGFGHTPYADHAAQVCAFEVVLPDGAVIETGLGALGLAAARNVYAHGIGPALSGLFFQSSLGIVTAMTVWLMPAPARFCAFFFGVAQADRFPHVIDAFRRLRLSGAIRSAVHIANVYRVLPALTQCPWARMEGARVLSGPLLDELKHEFGVLDWHGSGGLYGSAAQVREGKRCVRRALKGLVTRLKFVDDGRLAVIQRLRPLLRKVGAHRIDRQLDVLVPAYGLLKGIPTDRFLSTAYWRKIQPMPASPNPDRDRCGLIWCSVLSEASGEQANAVQKIATACLLESGFEPGVTTTFLGERCLEHVISIVYDRDVNGEDQAARHAFASLLEALMAGGYYPYRLPTFAQGILAAASPPYRALLARLKQTFDPQNLFANGRYTFEDSEQVCVCGTSANQILIRTPATPRQLNEKQIR